MKYNTYMIIVLFAGHTEADVFDDIVAVDQHAAHADVTHVYGECELLGFTQL